MKKVIRWLRALFVYDAELELDRVQNRCPCARLGKCWCAGHMAVERCCCRFCTTGGKAVYGR